MQLYNPTIFASYYNSLNSEQKEAVDTIDGPVLVIAGPGTGKTQLLSTRVANIVLHTDTNPENILCLTYTDSATLNMKKRLRSIMGIESDKISISTFHSLGQEIINSNPDYFFYGAHFTPIDDLKKIELIHSILSSKPLDDPLHSYHPTLGWVYSDDCLSRISELKNGGLTDSEFRKILDQNKKDYELIHTVCEGFLAINAKKVKLTDIDDLIYKLQENIQPKTCVFDSGEERQQTNILNSIYENYYNIFLNELVEARELSISGAKFSSSPITKWKNTFFMKDDNNQYVLRDYIALPKLYSLADVYKQYTQRLFEAGLIDFDDMLLNVVKALEEVSSLRYSYQEKFQYILVDEFQDTNGVQLRLINSLINTEITNNRPNILVVGDDDQAIYRFQGSNISNIFNFRYTFADTKIITLTSNYRSHQKILDFAEQIITNAEERLAHIEGVNKKIISQVNYENDTI